MNNLDTRVLKRAIVTERTAQLKEAHNQVVFHVAKDATKGEIKSAVEKGFNVKVEAVNTLVVRGKVKTMGRFSGKRANWKKAIVTLKDGSNITVMEGV